MNILSSKTKCPDSESNQGHEDFQSSALPTELSGHKTRVAGFEPANDGIRIRCLTAWRYPNIIYLTSWASWIRTNECRSQSPVPYRLAIAHYKQKKRETRFELAALALARRCSTTEPFAHIMQSRGLEPLPSLPGLDP